MNSLYLLWKYGKKLYGHEFANQMVERELVGEYYINDLSNVQKPYCFNFSAMDVMSKGLPFVKKINSLPAKHLSSFCGQMVHFTSYASNQVMGAVGIADLLIVMSFFVKKEIKENSLVPEEYIWRQVKQEIQSLIYSMNQPFRVVCSLVFIMYLFMMIIFLKVFMKTICLLMAKNLISRLLKSFKTFIWI